MATRKPKKEKSKPNPSVPKAEKILGYFRKGSTVGVLASMVSDEKIHKIETLLANTQKEAGVDEGQAKFAFAVLFVNSYPGGAIGKISHKQLGGCTVDLEAGTVQYSSAKRKTEVIRPKKETKPAPPEPAEAKV